MGFAFSLQPYVSPFSALTTCRKKCSRHPRFYDLTTTFLGTILSPTVTSPLAIFSLAISFTSSLDGSVGNPPPPLRRLFFLLILGPYCTRPFLLNRSTSTPLFLNDPLTICPPFLAISPLLLVILYFLASSVQLIMSSLLFALTSAMRASSSHETLCRLPMWFLVSFCYETLTLAHVVFLQIPLAPSSMKLDCASIPSRIGLHHSILN